VLLKQGLKPLLYRGCHRLCPQSVFHTMIRVAAPGITRSNENRHEMAY
jgi:hypothetical protein